MQRSLKRFVILSEKQRQSQDGELPTAPRPGSQRQHSSRLVQVLNSQLRRGDGGDGAQPGPATLAVGPSCTPGEGAIAAGSLPQQPGPCEQDAAAPAPCSPATRACPICGEQWPTADFEAHLTQELLALEEEDDDSAAQVCAVQSASTLVDSACCCMRAMVTEAGLVPVPAGAPAGPTTATHWGTTWPLSWGLAAVRTAAATPAAGMRLKPGSL